MSGNREEEWFVFTRNREAVVKALEEGRCDGILPAARGFTDGFADFCLESGVLEALEAFPDQRLRRTIPMFFFCHALVYRPLFHLESLAQIGRTLFRSPYIMRQLGFTARQIEDGFYDTDGGEKPFTVRALTEAFAGAEAQDFLTNQKEVLAALWKYCPGEFRSALWVMDSVHIDVSRGAHTPAHAFKACVLGVWQESVVWPLLWCLVPEEEADVTVGKRLLNAAADVVGADQIKHLLIDRGFLDGKWISTLHTRGTRVTTGVKQDMLVMEEMENLSRLADAEWEAVEPPKTHDEPRPEREVMGFSHLEGEWESCTAPLSGCLIRDIYPDKINDQGLVTTAHDVPATEILSHNGCRWTEEEVFMTLTRYWQFDDLSPCRLGVAYAIVHFALLAFTLLGFYFQEIEMDLVVKTRNKALPPLPLPERELAVYAGPHFALLTASELLSIVLDHVDAWQENKKDILLALRPRDGPI